MLQDFGYSVVDAEDADEAISVAVKSINRIDLASTDASTRCSQTDRRLRHETNCSFVAKRYARVLRK